MQFCVVNVALSGPCDFPGDSDLSYTIRRVFGMMMESAKTFVAIHLFVVALFFTILLACDVFYGMEQVYALFISHKKE